MAVINQVVLYNCESYLFYNSTYWMGRDVLFHLLQLFFFCLDCLLDFCLRVCEFYLRENHSLLNITENICQSLFKLMHYAMR